MKISTKRFVAATAALAAVFGLGRLILRANVPVVASTAFVATGDMVGGRAGAAATLLPDGMVLVTGGSGPSGIVDTAERYSPIGDGFIGATSMSMARANHTATLLTDGRVLVAGGMTTGGAATGGAEIFIPADNAWMPAGSLSHPRGGHTATLLADGRVLIVGGNDGAASTNSIEIFDPTTNTFTQSDAVLGAARTAHAAARLNDGRVLIAGGSDGSHALASTDIFDPDTNTISAGPAMTTPRGGATATTLLDGKVFVAGGANDAFELTSTEIFDPMSSSFSAGPSLDTARQGHLAFLLPHNNQVLIVGGTAGGAAVASAGLYTPWDGSYCATGGVNNSGICASGYAAPGLPNAARAWAAGSALSFPADKTIRTGPNDGLLLLAGGSASQSATGPVKSAELYGFATVKTDKEDYAPGTTVRITGSGWQPGEWVGLTLVESPLLDTHPLVAVQADGNGNILSTEFVPDEHDLNVRFYLTAYGLMSQAATTFLDNGTLNVVFAGSGGGTVTNSAGFLPASCSTNCSITVTSSSSFTLTATPNGSSSFTSWTGCITVIGNQCTIRVTGTSGTGSVTVTFTASTISTSTSVSSSSNPSTYGGFVSFTADVTPASGSTPPTGSVQFLVDGSNFGSPVPLSTGGSCPATHACATSNSTNTLSAATHPVSANYTATGGVFLNSSGTLSGGQVVNKATSVTTVTCPPSVTYTGSPITPCSVSVTGAGDLSLTPTPTYANNTNAGTATASYTFAGDANHTGSTDSKNFAINPASSTTTITCPTNVTYTGSPLAPCTATATGAGGLNVSVPVVYGNNTNAGTATADATYAGDANHNGSTATQKTFTIDKASSTTTVTCPTNVTYSGSPVTPCTATATGAGGLNVSVPVVHGNNTNAGTATADATYAGDANHNGSTAAQQTFTIDKASSTTAITCPTNVTYTGSPLTPCTATATGAGGLNQSLTVNYGNNTAAGSAAATASFAGDANHTSSSDSKNFTIDKAASTTTVTCPSNVTYTGSAQTPCTATVTGAGGLSLTPTPTYTNNTNAGTATASYTYAGDANHTGSSDSKTFTIDKAASLTTVTCPANVPYTGSAQTPCTVAVTGAGGLGLTPMPTYTNNVNAGTATASYTFAGDANHTGSNDSKNFNINQAPSTTVVTCPASVTYTGSAQTPCTVAVTGAGGLSLTPTPTYTNNVSAGTATASYTYAGDANHTGSSDSKNFTINQATSTTVVTVSNAVFDGNPHGGTAVVTGAGGLNQVLTVSYVGRNGIVYLSTTTPPTNAGDYTASATFAGDTNHSGSNDSKDYFIAKATSTTTVACPASVTYTGSALTPCSATVTGAGGLSLTPTPNYSNNTNAGTATGSYTYAGDANHTGSSDSKNFTIDKATPLITLTGGTFSYDANAHAAMATATGVVGETVAGAFTFTYTPPGNTTAPTSAGSYVVNASLASGDPNYANTSTNSAWVTRRSIFEPRTGSAADVVNGKLILVGGCDGSVPAACVHTTSYDPITQTWTAKADAPISRAYAGAAAIGNKLYVAGGALNANPGLVTAALQVYDAVADTWAPLTSMPFGRYQASVAAVGAKVYVAGGYGSPAHNDVQIYDTVTGIWATGAPMPAARAAAATAVVNGIIYVLGGVDGSDAVVETILAYNPATDMWTTKSATLSAARAHTAAAAVDGRILVAGGDGNTHFATVDVYDPATDTITSAPDLLTARSYLVAGAVGGTVYAVGGQNGSGSLAVNESFTTDALITINKADQTITFNALAGKTYGDADFSVSATASSGLTVSFSSQTMGVCTASGTTVHILAAGSCTIRASQSGNGNYNAAPDVDQSFTVERRTLTASIIGDPTKTYDGNDVATLTSANFSVSNLVAGESVTVTKTSGSYNSANVTAVSTVSTTLAAGDFTPGGGTVLANYDLPTSASGAGHITARTVTASIVGDPTRAYDGNTTATLTPPNFSLSGLIGSESFTVTKSSGTYNTKDVTTANTVTTSLTAGDFTAGAGTLASNYVLPTVASGAGHITAVTLTAAIIGDPTRPYNGNTTATLAPANFSLTPLVGSENFTVTQTSGSYNSKDVATANTVTASLTTGDFTPANGAAATNYVLPTTASGAGHITAVTVTAAIIGNPTKAYDGSTSAALTSANFGLSGLIGSESFTVTQTSGTYNSKDVVSATTVTASLSGGNFTPVNGADASNYSLPTTASGGGHMTPRTLTAAIVGDPTKTYDSTAAATLAPANFSLTPVVGGEGITVTKTSSTYNSANVAAATTVSATLAAGDFSPASGTLLSNYTLPTSASGAGHITPAPLSITADAIVNTPAVDQFVKTFDGSAFAAFTARYDGFVNSETPTVLAGALSFSGAGATAVNAGGPYTVTPGGLTSTNYAISFVDGALAINKATSTTVVTFEPGPYVYRASAFTATAHVTGVAGLDEAVTPVTYTGDCTNVTVANGCTASATYGGDANHLDSIDSKSITILKATPTVSVALASYIYDTTAHVATGSATGVGGDGTLSPSVTFSYEGRLATVYLASSIAPKDAGDYKVTASFAGNSNYNPKDASVDYTINRATATVTVSLSSYTYDGTAHVATGSVTGVGGDGALSPSVTFSYEGRNTTVYAASASAPKDAGDYKVTASFAGNSNYNPTNASADYTIGKATPLITMTGGTFTYDTFAHPATATATGVTGLSVAGSFTFTYTLPGDETAPVNAGSYSVRASFTSTDSNYADTSTNSTWITRHPLPEHRTGAAADVANGKLYVVGGCDGATPSCAHITEYDPIAQTWTTKADAPIARAYAGAAAIGDKLYVVGGCINADCNSATNALYVYDTANNNWTPLTPMPVSRAQASVTAVDGKVYVAGGFVAPSTAFDTVQIYDPASNTWSSGASMPVVRASAATAVVNGIVYVLGGVDSTGAPVNTILAYDPMANSWTTKGGTLSVARAHTAAAAVDGKIFVAGGDGESTYDTVDVYDAASDSASVGPNLLTTRSYLVAGAINGTVYAVGGQNGTGTLAVNESFTADARITINKADQTITFAALGGKTYGDADFSVSATADSGLAVSFSSQTLGVCTVSGTTVHIVAAGSCTIRASQAGNSNYNAAPNVDQSFTVDRRTLTATIIGDPTKTYDGNANATLTSANFSVSNLVPGESITVTKTTGTYNSANVTAANTVDVTLASIDFSPGAGTVLNNYNLPTTAAGAGHITAQTVTAAIIGDPTKAYNGNTTATLTTANFSLTGVVSGESFTVTKTSGVYDTKDVATASTVTASLTADDFTPGAGTLASNYALPTMASGAGHITAVTLTAAIIGDPTRAYNGNTTASLTPANFALTPLVGSESFTVTQASGSYDSKNVATANTVTASLTAGDFTPTNGAVATNYVLPTTASGAGHITAVTVTAAIIGNPTKAYDGNTSAVLTSVNFTLSGLIGSESFTVTQTIGAYNSKDVADAATLTAGLTAGDFSPASGTLASNYSLPTTASGAGHVTPRTLTVSIVGNPTKTYDGNDAATLGAANFSQSPVVGGESITVTKTSGTYNSADVATANTVSTTLAAGDFMAGSGTLLANYTLPTSASGSGHITPAALSITADANVATPAVDTFNKTYDTQVFSGFTARYSGFVNAENESALGGTLSFSGTGTTATGAGGPYTVTPGGQSSSNYTISFVDGTLTINQASSTTGVSVAGGESFTYDGNAHPATVSVTGAGGLNLTPAPVYSCGHAPLDVADSGCTASYTYAGDANHTGSSDSKTYTIGKADPVVVATGGTFTYDGNAHAGSGTAKGVKNEDLTPVNVQYSDDAGFGAGHLLAGAPSNAGAHYVAARYAGDANYNGKQSAAAALTINQATSTTGVSVAGGESFTYDGNAHPATVSVTGAGGLNLTPPPVYSCGHAPLDVADSGCTASYTYAGDANHTGSSDSKTYTIGKADPVVVATGGTFTYDGNAHAGSGTAKGVKNEDLTPMNVQYSDDAGFGAGHLLAGAPSNAGAHYVAARYAGDANYNGKQSAAAALTINQATSTTGVSVAGGENFTYDGNAHPATVSVTGAGGLNLTPAPVYSCGHAPLDVADSGCTASYTYAGDANHTGSSDSKTYTIGKADPVVVATGGTFTYDGSAHAGSAIATGVNSEPLTPVTVAYSVPPPGVGNLTGAPTNTGSYLVAARFAGNVNYNQKQSAAVALTIEQASSTTAVTCPAGPYTYNGAAQTPCSVAVTGAGGLNLTPAATYSNNVNAGTATASYTFAGDANHAGSSNSKTFTIDTAAATISVVGFSGVYDGNAHGVVSSSATGVNNESLTGLAFDATTYTNVPGGLVHWTFTNANYADQSGDATVAITQTGSTTTVTCPPGPHTYTGIAQTPCSAVATGAGVLNTSVTVTHGSNTNAGTATADASFAGDVNHSGSTATQKTFTIDQASSATTITCPASVTFNGSAQTPCSAAATGAGGLSTSVTVNHGNNTNVGTATADATYAGDANHKGSTAAEITFAIDLASSTTAVTVNDATYDGSSHGGTATVTGVGGLSQSLTVTYVGRNGTVYPSTTTAPTNAGDYTASASFSGDTNHGGSSDSRPFTIGKANATVTVNGYTGTYNGAAHGASGSANGVGGANLNAGLSLGATFTNAPGGTAQWNFSGGMNYKDRSGNVAIVINKANPTITVANYIVPFDGSSHSATGTAKGVVGETLAGLDLSGTTHTSVGTFADSWSFVDSTGNYNLASGSSNDQITAWKDTGFYSPVNMPAGSTIVWNVIKGGSTVPMKFNLYATAGGSEITSTTAVQGGSIAVYNASCGAGIYSDDTSVLTNTGATSLRYDTTGGQFIQNWQSPKAPGKCYAAVMTSSDGTSLVAYFQTK